MKVSNENPVVSYVQPKAIHKTTTYMYLFYDTQSSMCYLFISADKDFVITVTTYNSDWNNLKL